jgi:hypothetical protein
VLVRETFVADLEGENGSWLLAELAGYVVTFGRQDGLGAVVVARRGWQLVETDRALLSESAVVWTFEHRKPYNPYNYSEQARLHQLEHSSAHLFSSRICASSSGVKSLTMPNCCLISSGDLPEFQKGYL